jgi:hypothetical protein
MGKNDDRDEATIDLESVTAAGKRLKLKGRDLERYIHDHMVGFGYKSKRSYFKDEEGDEGSEPFWRRGKKDEEDDDL